MPGLPLQALPNVVLSYFLNRGKHASSRFPGFYSPQLLCWSQTHIVTCHPESPLGHLLSISQVECILFLSLLPPQCFYSYSQWFSFWPSNLPRSCLSSYYLDTFFFQEHFFFIPFSCTPLPYLFFSGGLSPILPVSAEMLLPLGNLWEE